MPETIPSPAISTAVIDRELTQHRTRVRFEDPGLESRYQAESDEQSRAHNRVTMLGLIAVYDLFIIQEILAIPETVRLSVWLRFGLLTPAAALWACLDWRGVMGRWNRAAVTALGVAPTLFASLEASLTVSPAALPNIQAIPLIQLFVLTSRLSLIQAAIANSLACVSYITAILICPVVPMNFLPSMILSDLAIGIASMAYAVRVDRRERKVFLLVQQAEHRRAALAEQNTVLTELSQVDALTGLANRRAFDEALAARWTEALEKGEPLGLIMIDIDHFKRYNDHYGHQGGDDCLRRVAEAARAHMRRGDLIARYGGEEFAVILPNAPPETVAAAAERIRAGVASMGLAHPALGPKSVVTISLGGASRIPWLPHGGEHLVEEADRNLYTAKRTGKNRAWVVTGTLLAG